MRKLRRIEPSVSAATVLCMKGCETFTEAFIRRWVHLLLSGLILTFSLILAFSGLSGCSEVDNDSFYADRPFAGEDEEEEYDPTKDPYTSACGDSVYCCCRTKIAKNAGGGGALRRVERVCGWCPGKWIERRVTLRPSPTIVT